MLNTADTGVAVVAQHFLHCQSVQFNLGRPVAKSAVQPKTILSGSGKTCVGGSWPALDIAPVLLLALTCLGKTARKAGVNTSAKLFGCTHASACLNITVHLAAATDGACLCWL